MSRVGRLDLAQHHPPGAKGHGGHENGVGLVAHAVPAKGQHQQQAACHPEGALGGQQHARGLPGQHIGEHDQAVLDDGERQHRRPQQLAHGPLQPAVGGRLRTVAQQELLRPEDLL
ncbi:hypothetical protein D3C72_1593840 [compost metagenome]